MQWVGGPQMPNSCMNLADDTGVVAHHGQDRTRYLSDQMDLLMSNN